MTNELLVVFGDQLFPIEEIKRVGVKTIFMAEADDLCRQHKHHKQKVLLFFESMRRYRDELTKHGFEVVYVELQKGSFFEHLEKHCSSLGTNVIHHFEIDDHIPAKNLTKFSQKFELKLTEHPTPKFLNSKSDFELYLKNSKKPFMKTFYERNRKNLKILMHGKEPVGGQYSFDELNRQPMPDDVSIPSRHFNAPPKERAEILSLIEKEFAEHPGDLGQFVWPTNRAGYLKLLDDFVEIYLEDFGPYQDAMSAKDPFLFHSLLSPGLNIGLITPRDILDKLAPALKNPGSQIASLEGYVRQLIGWREFVRGIYNNYSARMEKDNFWKSHRRLKSCWWDGTTGLKPLDDTIQKALKYGYAHHIERLMILGNIFNLVGVYPPEVYRWFMEMFIDSSDWVMQANVYGMGLMSDGGIFATKPYICGSNYILKMGDWPKGDWCETLDGLYWSFIERHQTFFESNPRMKMMVGALKRMDKAKLERIKLKAQSFIEATTTSS